MKRVFMLLSFLVANVAASDAPLVQVAVFHNAL